jgi:hypothetical protein
MERFLGYMRVLVRIIDTADGVLNIGDEKRLKPEIARDLIKRGIAVAVNKVPSVFDVQQKQVQITKTELI